MIGEEINHDYYYEHFYATFYFNSCKMKTNKSVMIMYTHRNLEQCNVMPQNQANISNKIVVEIQIHNIDASYNDYYNFFIKNYFNMMLVIITLTSSFEKRNHRTCQLDSIWHDSLSKNKGEKWAYFVDEVKNASSIQLNYCSLYQNHLNPYYL